MKKQLFRYKLKADQKVGRANKTEVLNEEVLQIEKHIEHIRAACLLTNKKLQQCILMNGGELEKRMKKLPESSLAQAMLDSSNQMQQDSDVNFSRTLKICSEAQFGVAKERALYEMFVEMHVANPLSNLVDHEIPSIFKLRERLKRLVLDRDHAYQSWHKAHKAQFTPGINLQQATAKAELQKEELDSAELRMEQCKDQLITEMFEFVTKEAKYTQHLGDYVNKELDYHRRCVAHLEKLQPDLENTLESASIRSCYGVRLSDHLRASDREIAAPIEACINCLVECGIYEEGIFRIAGGAAKLKKFRSLVDAGVMDLVEYDASDDIHAVAGALKQYLRELPDPLLTQNLYEDWLNISNYSDDDQRLQETWKVIDLLPTENKNNLRYLMKFCAVLASQKEHNKMSASNIALVLSPNLLWPTTNDISLNMQVSNQISVIIESIISYADWFFPEDILFSIPPAPVPFSSVAEQAGHGRSLSGGAVADNATPTQHSNNNNGSPKHSRSSSTDFASVATTATTIVSGIQTSGRKKRAPAPPPTAPPSVPDGNQSSKPPIAYKRTSFKKPAFQPPEPPKNPSNPQPSIVEETGDSASHAPKPRVRAKPPPPVRKRISHPPQEETVDTKSSSPSPDEELPPPPPESELSHPEQEDVVKSDGLLAELSLAQSKFTTAGDSSEEDQNTAL